DRRAIAYASGAALLEKLPTIHHGHHQIEQDAVRSALGHERQRFSAIAGCLDVEAVQLECLGDRGSNGVVVVDDENTFRTRGAMHHSTLPTAVGGRDKGMLQVVRGTDRATLRFVTRMRASGQWMRYSPGIETGSRP